MSLQRTANVQWKREELRKLLPQYELIQDCIDGETAVKYKKTKYLPAPNASDVSAENIARYEAYRTRAVFYNATGHTLRGLVGQVFLRDPVIEVPSQLDPVIEDGNGAKLSMVQLAKRAVQYVLAFGRAGFLSDYPTTENGVTVEQLQSGEIRPIVKIYHPTDIINWRTKVVGSRELLSLVVLHERYIMKDDGFQITMSDQWRVLRLEDVYSVEIWQKTANAALMPFDSFVPVDASGNPFKEIPFTFIGAENNDSECDNPPLYDLASLNIAHYRNSADYEESCFIVGQPTPYFAGLTEEWVKTVLNGVVTLGARAAIPLPENGSAGLLQAEPNTMPFEAMEHKEKQMVSLGAKIVEQKSVQRTATEASLESSVENSTLSDSAKNVSAATVEALKWCAMFAGVDGGSIKFELNTDFDLAKMTPDERRQTVSEWQSRAITFEEMRAVMKKGGVATLDDKEAKTAIDAETLQGFKMDEKDPANKKVLPTNKGK